MDEEITIINSNTRKEKIKNFFINNKKLLISIIVVLILILFSFFSYQTYKNSHRDWLANKYNSAVIEYENGDKSKVISSMKEIIEDKDSTYSPLALYILIDNNLIDNKDEVNDFFDILIDKTNLELEIKNLLIYKKALLDSNYVSESELLESMKPILNTETIWKPHALLLLGDYFVSKKEYIKAIEFYQKIFTIKNLHNDLYNHARFQLTLITNE